MTSEDAPCTGEKPLEANSDSDVPPSLHCQEHLIPSAASTSDEQATVDNPVLVDENEVVDTRVANDENTCQQPIGGETKDQIDASITDESVDKERRPDHSEGALQAKRRKICIPEVKLL